MHKVNTRCIAAKYSYLLIERGHGTREGLRLLVALASLSVHEDNVVVLSRATNVGVHNMVDLLAVRDIVDGLALGVRGIGKIGGSDKTGRKKLENAHHREFCWLLKIVCW